MKVSFFSLLVCALLVPLSRADDPAGALAVVVNKSVSLDDLSTVDLEKFFKMQKSKTTDGTRLTIVLQETGRPERAAMLGKVYKMGEGELGRYFLQATFTGAIAAAPKNLPDGAAVLKFVERTPGGLGYVRVSEVTDAVKVLKIDGKAPGTPGYLLAGK